MIVFPAIDIVDGKAVRLLRGDYKQMTVYDDDPVSVARRFEQAGATHLHVVDLEGALNGGTPNLKTIQDIASHTNLYIEVGGGVRSMDIIERYLHSGVRRVILGTAAVTDSAFTQNAIDAYGQSIAVGVDVKQGEVAIKGWTQLTGLALDDFCLRLQQMGVGTIICTDIARDGVLSGANRSLYANLQIKYKMQIIASGGVSSMNDLRALSRLGLYGAIVGKALYEGAIDLSEAIGEVSA
ncbi:MAG: 1-(5-phosphoribosyl)-5-[Clostridia bacterium]|nr:1-(5-phosphoribosyl)-5-[(5-phosphoribosylamino)methylideneamino]imidazole-4-carboxamide isomerase [Clostridia bacterium]